MNTTTAEKPATAEIMPRPPGAELVPQSETVALLQMIERVARDPAANVDNLERLLAMRDRIAAQRAKADYIAARIALKPKLPVIDRKGRIEVREKVDGKRTGAIQQSTDYAKWEDIDEAITPLLTEHNFSLEYHSGVAGDGKITVTAI